MKNEFANVNTKNMVQSYKDGLKAYNKQHKKNPELAEREDYERALKNQRENWGNLKTAIERFLKENGMAGIKLTPKMEKQITERIKNKDLKTIREYEKKHPQRLD